MSREEHDAAARRRIEALEADLARVDADLASGAASLAERDAEIARLRAVLARPGGPRPHDRSRLAFASASALGLAMIGAASLSIVSMIHCAPPPPVVQHQAAPLPPPPLLADPAPPPPAPLDRAPEEEPPTVPVPPSASSEEMALRRKLEPKVWSGRASVEEIRMLKAICSHMRDLPCRDRARRALEGELGIGR